MICTRCGSPEAEDSVYCSGCGALLTPSAPTRSETVRPTPVVTEAASPAQPQEGYGHARATGLPGPQQEGSGAGTFMSSLFDINFRTFVTPKVIKIVYVLVMIVLGLSAIGYDIFALRVNAVFG